MLLRFHVVGLFNSHDSELKVYNLDPPGVGSNLHSHKLMSETHKYSILNNTPCWICLYSLVHIPAGPNNTSLAGSDTHRAAGGTGIEMCVLFTSALG